MVYLFVRSYEMTQQTYDKLAGLGYSMIAIASAAAVIGLVYTTVIR